MNNPPQELLQFPQELHEIIISSLKHPRDIRAMSCTCRAMQTVTSSLELKAAWLWQKYRHQALFRASLFGPPSENIPLLRRLIHAHNVDVNAQFQRDSLGGCCMGRPDRPTMLQRACRDGDAVMVEFLLTIPAIDVNVSHRCPFRYTALDEACQSTGAVAVVQLLLQHPDIRITDDTLKRALSKGDPAIVDILLGCPSIQVNTTSTGIDNPLIYAVIDGNTGVVEVLLGRPLNWGPEAVEFAKLCAERFKRAAMMALLAKL